MPNYFDEYDTTVNFISEDEFKANHTGMPHGGFVIRSGDSGANDKQILEFSLKLDSNPNFTSSVLVAYARATHRLSQAGDKGRKQYLISHSAYFRQNQSLNYVKNYYKRS